MSNNIKKIISNKIVEPATDSRSSTQLLATVTNVNEKLNVCDITYTNRNGTKETRSNVSVMLYNTNVIDWFPKVGDKVVINIRDEHINITSPAYDTNEYKNIRENNKITQDIFSDSFIDYIGGYLF